MSSVHEGWFGGMVGFGLLDPNCPVCPTCGNKGTVFLYDPNVISERFAETFHHALIDRDVRHVRKLEDVANVPVGTKDL